MLSLYFLIVHLKNKYNYFLFFFFFDEFKIKFIWCLEKTDIIAIMYIIYGNIIFII